MATTWFEEGLEKGRQEGLLQGQRRLLQLQLEKLFGPLSPSVRTRLEAWPLERVEEAALKIREARSLEELGLGEHRPA
jgi:hypothetical protein